ncbi:MAG: hypothetical protein AAFN93_15320, partial [Bacteroidota bacterium]
MKLKYLFIIAFLFNYTLSFSQPDNPEEKITLSTDIIQLSLFPGESEHRTVNVDNISDEDFEISLSLQSTSHVTESNQTYLGNPLMFKMDYDVVWAHSGITGRRNRDYFVRLDNPSYRHDGLAYDGEHLYYAGGQQTTIIYKVHPLTDLLVASTEITELADITITGLAYSGEFIYAANMADNLIYKIDFESGTVVEQFPVNNVGKGLTFGGDRGTLFILTTNHEIIEMNIVTKEIINTIPMPLWSEGIGYSKEMGLLFTDEEYYEGRAVDPDTGEILHYTGGFGRAAAGNESFGLFWLGFTSPTLTLNAGASESVEVLFDATELEPGLYRTTVQFALNDEDDTMKSVPVELTVIPSIKPLSAESFCTVGSGEENIWKIYNPNSFPVNAYWEVDNSIDADSIRLQPGENVLFTTMLTDALNVLHLTWLDERDLFQESYTTANNEICDLRGLTINPACTDNRDAYRQWEIINPNLFPVMLEWELIGTDGGGDLTVESGTTSFNTSASSAEEIQTIQIKWFTETGDVKRQRKASSNIPCDLRGLTLNSVCTDDPDLRKRWEVINPNAFAVQMEWEQLRSDLGEIISVAPGSSYFYSGPEDVDHVVKIIWMDEEGNVKRQQKTPRFGVCTSGDSQARMSSETNDIENEIT